MEMEWTGIRDVLEAYALLNLPLFIQVSLTEITTYFSRENWSKAAAEENNVSSLVGQCTSAYFRERGGNCYAASLGGGQTVSLFSLCC